MAILAKISTESGVLAEMLPWQAHQDAQTTFRTIDQA